MIVILGWVFLVYLIIGFIIACVEVINENRRTVYRYTQVWGFDFSYLNFTEVILTLFAITFGWLGLWISDNL
ncbi:hypothetical protein A3E06_03580 [Candidatus Giovannonibacteria bacterium RIFCSPHIGHO2_12_FULL_44_42]|nr:MAG: hypothetical protein UW28_C0037G0002 [Parcubacteria group bacterium GW2011_GWA2_44_13]OGF74086.1 MAG: hypothetical protein A3E06_03580 [Candidatus Giovannonibacteria bacterium RIFCSPHIGHO2_12_FULL_44_42]OGF89020.1 MAG: hypothetical protein A3I94_04160 [Candidatus Giovannonibacteria bacterium RIFCSPLOWO2_02_FULL_43_54]